MAQASPGITFVAATQLEFKALRRELPDARTIRTGIAFAGLREDLGSIVVSCGVAGALRPDLPTGTALIPREVLRPSGDTLRCDGKLVDALAARARSLGIVPVFDPLLTASEIVCGNERAMWARRGYAGVDMESGLIHAPRLAVVRVILDTPERELSDAWLRGLGVIFRPDAWRELPWLARFAPRYARLAASIVRSTSFSAL